MSDRYSNPALYRKLAAPHATEQSLDEALDRFYTGVRKLREECGIPEVVILVEANVLTPHGESSMTSSLHLGNMATKVIMLARAYGQAREAFDGAVNETVVSGRTEVRNRREGR